MKIIKNTSDKIVSSLTKISIYSAEQSDNAYNVIMTQLNDINKLINFIDPQQHPEYFENVRKEFDKISHELNGIMEAIKKDI